MPTPPSSAPTGPNSGPVAVLNASEAPVLMLPTGFSLLAVTFALAGDDLVIAAPDGRWALVESFMATKPHPDLADPSGGFLSGDIVAAMAAGDGELSFGLLEAIAGFETAAGPSDAPGEGFASDLMSVTMGFRSPEFDPVGALDATQLDAYASYGPSSGDALAIQDHFDPDLESLPRITHYPEIPPSRIIAMGESDVEAWSHLPGAAWKALVPIAGQSLALYYRTAATVNMEREFIDGSIRRFLPTEADGMLVMAAGSIAPFGLEGSAKGSAAREVLDFIDSTGDTDFDPDWEAVDGAVIRASIDVPSEASLLVDIMFDPVNTETANDFAFLAVGGEVFRLADVLGAPNGVAGWRTIGVQNTTDGLTTIALGVMNAVDDENNPYLAVDNLHLHAESLAAGPGERVDIDGETLYVLDLATGANTPDIEIRTLVRVPIAADDAYSVAETGFLDSDTFAALPGLLDNDTPPQPSYMTLDGLDLPLPLSVVAVDGLSDAVGTAIPLERSSGSAGGLLTVEADGSFFFDPGGDFHDLDDGESETLTFDYTVSTDDGGRDTATATITVQGEGGPLRLADFETGVLPGPVRGDTVIVNGHQNDGFEAIPASGVSMLKLESDGSLRATIRDFIGLDRTLPLRDYVDNDNSLAVRGSALKLEVPLEAGSTVSFFWWFDNAELVTANAPGYNDFGLFKAGDQIFRFVDGRMQYALTNEFAGHLESFWTQWTVPATGETELSWAVFEDAGGSKPATVLIDLVQVDAPVPDGYTIVSEFSEGAFETYAPPGFG